MQVLLPNGDEERKPLYEATLFISEEGFSKRMDMAAGDILERQQIIALIGMDVLRHGTLTYRGPDDEFEIDLPKRTLI